MKLAFGGWQVAVWRPEKPGTSKKLKFFVLMALGISTIACSNTPMTANKQPMAPTPSPIITPFVPKNGDYQGRGRVTRIEIKGGSVELDHEAIADVMAAMKMEFFVSDKAMLSGIKLGDEVNFTLRYNNGQETIVAISKIK